MKIRDILQQKEYALSFEVFPPKTDSAYDSVKASTEAIAKLVPSFMSVTYGAGGGTSAYTLSIAEKIKKDFGVTSLAHLTCISSNRETVCAMIEEFRRAGIENIMALRGDIPQDRLNEDRSSWCYHHASDLIREIKRLAPELCVGGACYPEVHPESADQREDILRLKEKVDLGVDFLTTQMFFDNNLFYNFLFKIREAEITVPVLPGIMPITNAKQVARAIELSGSFVPQRFKSIVDRFGSDDAAMQQAGIAYATDQIIDLFANGITHVHVYTMNKPAVAASICKNLSDILGKSVR